MSTETTDIPLNKATERRPNKAESLLGQMIHFFEFVGLTVIALATIYAGAQEVMSMINHAQVTLGDLLLLFQIKEE